MGVPTFVNVLRVWIGLVGIVACGNTIQCYIGSPSYVHDRLYTLDKKNGSALASHLFGMWTLLAAALRLSCAIHINNKVVYHLTLFSFVVVFFHFTMEVFVYKTAALTPEVVSPLLISGLSAVAMLIGFWYVDSDLAKFDSKNENIEILRGMSAKKKDL